MEFQQGSIEGPFQLLGIFKPVIDLFIYNLKNASHFWVVHNILPGTENRKDFVREEIRRDFHRAFLWVSEGVEIKFSDEI